MERNVDKYVFEVLIYRENERVFYDKYQHALDDYIIKFTRTIDKSYSGIDRVKKEIEQSFWERYGGPWNYNQAIGAIRIFITGNQLRGDFWLSNKKRFTHIMKNKNISLQGKAFEFTVFPEMDNADIVNQIEREIKSSVLFDKRLFLDLECFENIAGFIDWISLLKSY